MNRAEALAKMRHKYKRKSLHRTPLGGRVICDRTEPLFQEHPDVYKPIESVMASVIEAGLAEPIAALEPLITVKR